MKTNLKITKRYKKSAGTVDYSKVVARFNFYVT
jgi:hypothetical protein